MPESPTRRPQYPTYALELTLGVLVVAFAAGLAVVYFF